MVSSNFFTSSLGFFSARNSLKKAIFSQRTKLTACRLATLSIPVAEASAMDSNSSCMLMLCGKSLAENKIAEALKNTNALKLTDNSELSILLDSELEKPLKEDDAFGIDSFMNSLSTNRFGRVLLWSPRLPSTHDVVSQPVEECVGISQRLPAVFLYSADGGWASRASNTICGVSSRHRGH